MQVFYTTPTLRICLEYNIMYLGVFSGPHTATLVLPVLIPTMLQSHSLPQPSCLSLMSSCLHCLGWLRSMILVVSRIHSVQSSSRLFRNRGNQNYFKIHLRYFLHFNRLFVFSVYILIYKCENHLNTQHPPTNIYSLFMFYLSSPQ